METRYLLREFGDAFEATYAEANKALELADQEAKARHEAMKPMVLGTGDQKRLFSAVFKDAELTVEGEVLVVEIPHLCTCGWMQGWRRAFIEVIRRMLALSGTRRMLIRMKIKPKHAYTPEEWVGKHPYETHRHCRSIPRLPDLLDWGYAPTPI